MVGHLGKRVARLFCVPERALLFPGVWGGFVGLSSEHVCKSGSHTSEHTGEPA